MTRRVTRDARPAGSPKGRAGEPWRMTDCEFCATCLDTEEPANVVLLGHLQEHAPCREQFDHMVENIRSSWTASMSGP